MKFKFDKVSDLVMKPKHAHCLFGQVLPFDKRDIERNYGNIRVIVDGRKTQPFFLNTDVIKQMIQANPDLWMEFGIGLATPVVEATQNVVVEKQIAEEELLEEELPDDFFEDPVVPEVPAETGGYVEPTFSDDVPFAEPLIEGTTAEINVEDMSYAELKEELTLRGIEFKGNISKRDAIELLKEE